MTQVVDVAGVGRRLEYRGGSRAAVAGLDHQRLRDVRARVSFAFSEATITRSGARLTNWSGTPPSSYTSSRSVPVRPAGVRQTEHAEGVGRPKADNYLRV